MLHSLIAGSGEASETILAWIEAAALAIEIVAVLIIVVSIFYSLGSFLLRRLREGSIHDPYWELKGRLARTMLLGLEILVAADIVRTVALESTLESVAILGLLVLIRTFLGWALSVELEGRWPWQGGAERE